MSGLSETARACEHPILMDAAMVQAILDGRKTQTRRVVKERYWRGGSRVVKLQDEKSFYDVHDGCIYLDAFKKGIACRYGKPGDRLWVRETFNVGWLDGGKVLYRADGGSAKAAGYPTEPKWKPSIFMPRWASRITLELTEVRVQRLQDISEEDAVAEGAEPWYEADLDSRGELRAGDSQAYRAGYMNLWESIHGDGSWDANPWVWPLTFRKLTEQERAA